MIDYQSTNDQYNYGPQMNRKQINNNQSVPNLAAIGQMSMQPNIFQQQMQDQNQQFQQNQGRNSYMGNNQSIVQNVPMSNSIYSQTINPKKNYAQELQEQIRIKEQQRDLEKQKQRQMDERFLYDVNPNDYFGKQGGGAPIRDPQGNVLTTRKNPYNPNYMSYDWFRQSPQPYNQLQQPLLQQQQQQQFNNVSPISGQANLMQQQPQMQMLPESNIFAQGNNNNNQNLVNNQININSQLLNIQDQENQRRRQVAQQLQNEQLLQMEEKRRQKEQQKMEEKKRRDQEDLRIQRERSEMEQRMQLDNQQDSKLGKKNLQESNFDQSFVSQRKTQQQIQQSMMQTKQQLEETHQALKQQTRPRTPVENAEEDHRNQVLERERIKIEQRIIKELPIEITAQVRETVNAELMKLRNEVAYQQNHLGEQLMTLKNDVMSVNQRRSQVDVDLRSLRDELKKTQFIDDIRQKEIYNAYIFKSKPDVQQLNTEKIVDQNDYKFMLPKRPRPYFNYQNPYINDNNEINKDIHDILKNESTSMAVQHYTGTRSMFDEKNVEDKMLLDEDDKRYYQKKGIDFDKQNNIIELPNDTKNRQRLYLPHAGEGDVNLAEILIKNESRLDALQTLDENQDELQNNNIAQLDAALFDMASNVSVRKPTTNYRYDEDYTYQR